MLSENGRSPPHWHDDEYIQQLKSPLVFDYIALQLLLFWKAVASVTSWLSFMAALDI